MQSYSEWILCPSKSFPGKFYYFNVRNGKAAWGPGDAEITARRPLETPKETESLNQQNGPPVPYPLQHDFFLSSKRQEVNPFSSVRQTPETRQEVIPFNSIQQTPETRHEVNPFRSVQQTPETRQNAILLSSIQQTPETRHDVNPFSSLRQTPETRQEVTPFSSIQQTPEIRHEVNPFSSVRQTPETRQDVTPFSFLQQTPETRHEVNSFSSVRQTPETRQEVTSLNSIHHPKADPSSQNFLSFNSMRHPTPVFGQKTLPQGLPKHKDSNVIWTPIQIQLHIPFQSQGSTTFGDDYAAFRDHVNISDADRSQVSPSMEGLKYIVTQGFGDTECQEILVNASNIPMHQRFVNFEATAITFSTVNKDNIKRLNETLKSSTPIKKSRVLEDPRLVNKPRVFESKLLSFADFEPKTGNPIIKESVLNFGLTSNTNKQDVYVGQPTKIQEPRNQNFNAGPCIITSEPVSNDGLLTKFRAPLLSNGLPSKSKKTSLNFEPPPKTKEPYVNLGPLSITTEPLFNLEPPLKTKEPVLYFEPQEKQPIFNDGPHSKTKVIDNFEPPLKTKEPVLQTNEPVFNGQALKANGPVLNGLPSKPTEKGKEEKEAQSVLGCVKSLKSCIKVDKGENAEAKSFDDDLRAILISKRKSQDYSNAEFQGSKPKISKQETPVKKKVTFNLDHESMSMVSSIEDAEDMKCAFVELYRPTVSYLKGLAPSSSQQEWWCILADTDVLTTEFQFIDDFVQIDLTCKLLIPPVVHSWLLALARGCDRPLATAARNVLRRTTSSHVEVQPCTDLYHDNPTCTNDDILRCCVENMDQNKHLVLISNDLELLTTAKCYPIPCYSMNSIKNGLPTTKQLQYKKDMKITIRNDTANVKNDSAVKKSSHDHDLNEKAIRNLEISKYPIGQNPKLKEKNQNVQNDNPNGKFQNGQSGNGPNEKNQNPIKYFYHDENMRIADAIEMYHTDSENITPSVNNSEIPNGTHEISNIPTIQNESLDIEKQFQSMEIDKPIQSINNENSDKANKIAEAGRRFESEMTKTTLEDDIQKLNIKDIDKTKFLNTDKTVSVFLKNQKPDGMEKFKYLPEMKISLKNNIAEIHDENNKQIETEKVNQEHFFKNRDPRLETRKSNDSILEFCKEKIKEPPTTEFESGKTYMASQCQKIVFEFENGKNFVASQYDRTKFENQNGKTNMSSQLDRSKSNMASTSNGFDVSKPQTMKNRIDLMRFYVKSKDVELRLKTRMDEWACFYTQIMEDSLSTVLKKQSPSVLNSSPPWSLFEALQCIDAIYEDNTYVIKIVGHLCSCLYESPYKMKKLIRPEEFMRALGCGAKLLEYLEIILPSITEIQDGVTVLLALLDQIEDDSDPTVGLSEPPVPTPLNSKTELDVRHNFVKDRSEITDFLKKHYAAWKDYDPSQDIQVFRTRGKKGIKLEKMAKGKNLKDKETIDRNGNVSNDDVAYTETNNVGNHCCDKSNVDDIDLFGFDSDDTIYGRKENYNKKKTGALDDSNKHVENKCNKANDGKAQDEKGPTIIRNVGILNEFESKMRKRKTKPDYVDIKPVKKRKIYLKTASNDKVYVNIRGVKVIANPKNTVYRPEKDPKLINSPRVVIKANVISDYIKKMRLKKAKKLFYTDQTEDNDNYYTKKKNKHNKYSLNSYNGKNNNHTVRKNHKDSYNSDDNDNQVTKVKNKKNNHDKDDNDNHNDDNNNHKDDNDNNNKDVTTDSGLGNELPRWSSVVDSYTADIEKNMEFILRDMNSEQFAGFREDSAAETLRMRAFEIEYLVRRILGVLRTLLHQSTDEEDRARNVDAITKYMAQAKSIHELVNSILSVTNYLLPVSSGMSFNS